MPPPVARLTGAELLLGFDVGTSFCKAAVVTLDGAEAAHGAEPTPWKAVPTGAEVEPDALVAAALAAARRALAAGPEGRVVAVGVTSMAETGILLDEKGEPVAPSIAWHDWRGGEEAASLADDLGSERFTERTGLPPTRLCSLSKYRWLRRNHPPAVHGRRWLNVSEWIVRALGGEDVAELSLASRTGFLDVPARAWWHEALEWAEAPAGLFPDPVAAGTPAGRVSGPRFPEAEGAVLTVAGHDHLAASVGAGATRDGDVFDSCGTAEALVRALEPPVSPEAVQRAVAGGVNVGWHVFGGRQALLGGFRSGLALRRFLNLLGADESGREELDRGALAVPAGVGGLTVVDPTEEVAALTGITWEASPAAVWRAALEAVAAYSAEILATIEGVAGPTERLVVTGGWARSEAFRAVKEATVGGFEQPPVVEAGARGAALLAGVAAGVYASDRLPNVPAASISGTG